MARREAMMANEKVRNIGRVSAVRASDELKTFGFRLEDREVAIRFAAKVLEIVAAKKTPYVWVGKKDARLYVTTQRRSDSQ
jgi:hypothetical protein